MYAEFRQTAKEIFDAAEREGRLIRNPDWGRLRALAKEEAGVVQSKYHNLVVESEPKSRAAMMTKNNIDEPFGDAERQLLRQAKQRLAKEELVSIEVEVGDGSEGITARLIVPRTFSHIVYAGAKLFKSTVTDNPTYQVVLFFDPQYEENKSKALPQKDITIRLSHSADGHMVKFARNTNYFGEWKKGVFAGEDYRVKLKGNAIFLHAGCRKDTLETSHGPYMTSYSLFVGAECQRQDEHHLQAAGPQGPRALVAHPGRRRHALSRRHLPRLRGGRAVHQDRRPESRRAGRGLSTPA